jgi:hypothetical protein
MLSACNNLGDEKTYNGVELYHTKSVTDAEASKLGNYLVTSQFADGKDKTVQLTKSGDVYQFNFVVKNGVEKDTSIVKNTKLFASILSAQVFNGAKVEVHMCDEYMKSLKVFVSDDLGKEKNFDGTELFYTKDITEAEVDSLGSYLVREKFANGKEKTAQITKKQNTYQFRFVVKNGVDKDPDFLKNAKVFASDLSANVFAHSPVEVDLCDAYLSTLAAVQMDDPGRKM